LIYLPSKPNSKILVPAANSFTATLLRLAHN